jgi:hypothetical protein
MTPRKRSEREVLHQLLTECMFDADHFLVLLDRRLGEGVNNYMSILNVVTSGHTLTLAAVATLGLAAFGVDLGVGDNQVALGLALYAASSLAED